MQITRNVITISDLHGWIEDRQLIVNRDYQRERGIWPSNARTYFIETILEGYPFPKVTLRQSIDLRTKKSFREIIDGQQRLTTISDFINNKFSLTNISRKYRGLSFDQLDDGSKEAFLRYEVSVDLVISATDEEILNIFRRINSYNITLNEAESRHATYQGMFKWFIKDLIERYTLFFETYEILSKKQISRMADADLMTEMTELLIVGVKGRNKKSLESYYANFDKEFANQEQYRDEIESALNYIKDNFVDILEQKTLTNYLLYSLVAAMFHNKLGLQSGVDPALQPIGVYCVDVADAQANISRLLSAYEQKDTNGEFGSFVKACITTTHSLSNRKTRTDWFIKALRNEQ